MYGYPGVIQVKDVINDQEKLLTEQINDVEKIMYENKKETNKLVAELESLFKMESQ